MFDAVAGGLAPVPVADEGVAPAPARVAAASGETVGSAAGTAVGIAVEALADSALVGLMQSAARSVASAEALGLAAAAELARRREAMAEVDPLSAPVDEEERSSFVATEVAAALRLSPGAARDRLALAEDLATRLPQTRRALAAGRLSLAHAWRVHEAVAQLDDDVAASVEEAVIERAARQTPAQLGASLRRAVLRAEPDGGRERCRRAEARREVRVRPEEDGLATLSITGRAELVAAAYERITAAARERQRASREHGARREAAADSAASAFGEQAPAGGPLGLEQARADVALELLAGDAATLAEVAGVAVALDVVAPAATVLGAGDEPGELVGFGPLPAHVVRELAGDATWRRWWTAPGRDRDSRSAGLDAGADAPAAGTVVGVGRRRYRPTAALAKAIRARDGECRFPTCRRRARACDLDHLVAFSAGGHTAPGNLLTLCRHHHRLKHRAGWTVAAGPAGTAGPVSWTSPAGVSAVSEPRRWAAGPAADGATHRRATVAMAGRSPGADCARRDS